MQEGVISMTEEIKHENRTGSLLASFLVGGIVGAGAALLLAPKKGQELRKDIKDIAVTTEGRVVSAVEKARDVYDESRSAVKSAFDAGKEAYIEERDRHLKAA